ncbi:MAG: polyphosphate polymerase domain-containing protein [Flavobacteriales bacterium]|nr:polyphosphate polymerase domain-containing protein [Flavobacteriales bacterium]
MSSIDNIIASFNPISLKEMDSVALMNRTDTKYLIPIKVAEAVLEEMSKSYRVLQIGEKRAFQYRTIYFDTIDKNLLYEHLRGKLNRVKVRAREYVGSATRFFEVKLKTNKGKTVKKRIPKSENLNGIQENEATFLSSVSKLNGVDLFPVIEIDFKRITLVNLELKERITFDFRLTFSEPGGEKVIEDLVIVELKRDSVSDGKSPATVALKHNSSYPLSMSKYCLGMILMDETNRYNKYKPKLLKLNKLSTHGDIW